MNEPQSLPFTVGTGSFWDILAPQERKLIEWVEWDKGRQLTKEEITLDLEQAREIGNL